MVLGTMSAESSSDVGEISPASSGYKRTMEGRQMRGKAPDIPIHERKNWLIHLQYVRKDYETCKVLIREMLAETDETCEYAIYILGLISRQEGDVQRSLELFQKALELDPRNAAFLKQMSRSLFLLGQHKAALDAYKETSQLIPTDWELVHNKGICFLYLKEFDKAIDCFRQALSMSENAVTYVQLGRAHLLKNSVTEAISVYQEAIEHFPEDPDLLATLGLLYMETKQYRKAFEFLGNALTYDSCNTKAILAAGCMMQEHGDYDVALSKYRIAASSSPESPQLWNNIGMCFFGKRKYVAAISCLKRANYLSPFDWKILYNLGLVHLTMQQYASAFHFLSGAISRKARRSDLFMLLGVTLSHLNDWKNAQQAYQQAIALDKNDPLVYLNFAVGLYNKGDVRQAAKQFREFEAIVKKKGTTHSDPEILELSSKLGPTLQVGEDLVKE